MNRRRFVTFLLFLSCFAFAKWTFDPGKGWADVDEKQFLGTYSLRIFRHLQWGNDFLKIQEIATDTVRGEVGIDWSIGPQARTPLPHEVFYTIPFTARRNCQGNGFTFPVQVADQKEYRFEALYADLDAKPILVGKVEIAPLSGATNAPASESLGFVAPQKNSPD